MAHIVCMTTGLTGILHASYAVVARLEAAGHRVTYASPGQVGDKVEAQGIPYVQLPKVVYETEPPLPTFDGPLAAARRWCTKWVTLPTRRRMAVEALQAPAVAGAIESLAPDLLLIDMELHDYIITAVGRGVPVVLLSQWFSTWRRPGLPPINARITPDRTLKGRLKIQRLWLRRTYREWRRRLAENVKSGFTGRRSALRKYAKTLGVPTRLLQSYNWPPPFTYRDLPVLSLTTEQLEFPHTVRPRMHYVGPMVHEGRKEAQRDPLVTDRLEAVYAHTREPERSLIVCSVSTMDKGDVDLLKRVVAAVVERPEWTLIIGLGGRIDEGSLGPLPSNVHAFSWIPQLEVLRRADCSINHGGIHTINECVHFGVPMLIYSGRQHDQNGCAARMAYHGVCVRGDKKKVDAGRIRQNIERVLNDETIKAKIQSVAEHCRSDHETQRLATLVQGYLDLKR